MGRFKVPYLVEKKQKKHCLYYWQPNKKLRNLGFLPRRLAERTNSLPDAIREAEALNAELDAWRAGETVDLTPQEGTLPWLIRHYQQSEKYKGLAPKTQRSYDQCMKIIEAWSEQASHSQIASIVPLAVERFYKSMLDTPHQAAAVIRVLRILLNRAVKYRLIDSNPAAKPEIRSPAPRDAVWTDEATRVLIETANNNGRRSIALAVMLAKYTGQRQGDILRLSWNQYDGETLRLRQRKTGKVLAVPVIAILRQWLDGTSQASPIIVLSEATGRPYREDNFRHVFSDIRDRAGVGELQFRDLRRTAAVQLAEAGCTAPEIAAITGHAIESTQKILETYVPRTSTMARNAMLKLERNKSGSELEG